MLGIVTSGLYVGICLLLLFVVLLQQGKGGDIVGRVRRQRQSSGLRCESRRATVLTRATTVLGALFMVGAIVLAILGERGPGSVLSGVDAPPAAPVEAAPVEAPPAEPAPATSPEEPD